MTKDKVKISEIIPDNRNYNKGTQFGDSLLDKSLRNHGAGRSILLDKNLRIIAGNKTAQKYGELGNEDVQLVHSDGKRLIAVVRDDIDLDTEAGRELALADNAVSKVNLDWNEDHINEDFSIQQQKDWGIHIQFEDVDYSERNKEIDVDDFEDQMKLNLTYESGVYWKVREELSKIAQTPEGAIIKLLGIEA